MPGNGEVGLLLEGVRDPAIGRVFTQLPRQRSDHAAEIGSRQLFRGGPSVFHLNYQDRLGSELVLTSLEGRPIGLILFPIRYSLDEHGYVGGAALVWVIEVDEVFEQARVSYPLRVDDDLKQRPARATTEGNEAVRCG